MKMKLLKNNDLSEASVSETETTPQDNRRRRRLDFAFGMRRQEPEKVEGTNERMKK
jgi:hypothetical protein